MTKLFRRLRYLLRQGRMEQELAHGLSALDPGAYLGAASLLAITGVGAVYLPARRATRVEPTSALRCE